MTGENVQISIPRRLGGLFGDLLSRDIRYTRTPELEAVARAYVDCVLENHSQFQFQKEGPEAGYAALIAPETRAMQSAARNVKLEVNVPNTKRIAGFIFSYECLHAADALNRRTDFVTANAGIHDQIPTHPALEDRPLPGSEVFYDR